MLSCDGPDVTVVKVYLPQDGQIQVHQTRVTPSPEDIPAGYYWYGRKKHSPGRPPQWVTALEDVSAAGETGENRDESNIQVPPSSLSKSSSPGVESDADEPTDTAESAESDEETTEEPESSRVQTGRYALRKRVKPPARLFTISSGRASVAEGVM